MSFVSFLNISLDFYFLGRLTACVQRNVWCCKGHSIKMAFCRSLFLSQGQRRAPLITSANRQGEAKVASCCPSGAPAKIDSVACFLDHNTQAHTHYLAHTSPHHSDLLGPSCPQPVSSGKSHLHPIATTCRTQTCADTLTDPPGQSCKASSLHEASELSFHQHVRQWPGEGPAAVHSWRQGDQACYDVDKG